MQLLMAVTLTRSALKCHSLSHEKNVLCGLVSHTISVLMDATHLGYMMLSDIIVGFHCQFDQRKMVVINGHCSVKNVTSKSKDITFS